MDTYDIFRVASAPLDIVWADRDANLAAVDAIVDKVEDGADLLVLPELFSTGYVNDPQLLADIAETNTGRTVDRLKEWASRRSIAIAGSFLARTAHRYYNRAFFIEPSGEETYYDKRHLFSLSDEAKVYAQGVTHNSFPRMEHIHDCVLRPAFSGMVSQHTQFLRLAPCAVQLAAGTRICFRASADSPCYRESGGCGRRKPRRRGRIWEIRRPVVYFRLQR